MTRARRAVLILLATPMVLAAAAAAWIHHVAGRRWAAAVERFQAFKGLPEDPPAPRPAFPDALPGEPDADYLVACKGGWQAGHKDLRRLVESGAAADVAEARAFLALNATLLEAVERGARRESPPKNLDPVFGLNLCTSMGRGDFDFLGRLAVLRSRFAGGGPARAARPLLAHAGMMTDILRIDGLRSSALQASKGLGPELASLAAADGWSREDLERLDRTLDVLDARVTLSVSLRARVLGSMESLLEEPPEYVYRDWTDGWRFGFSTRLLLADAFEWLDDWVRTAERARASPYAEAAGLQARVSAEQEASKNPAVRELFLPDITCASERELKAWLRLSRVAARYRIDGTVLDLEDPFGGRLQVERNDRALAARSSGSMEILVRRP